MDVPVSVTAGACVVLDEAVAVGSVGLGALVAVIELVKLSALTATPADDGATGAGLVDAFAAWRQA